MFRLSTVATGHDDPVIHRKLVMIAFSGGFDSAYLAHDALHKGCDVILVYSKDFLINYEGKTRAQNEAVASIVAHLKQRYPDQKVELYTVSNPIMVEGPYDETNLEAYGACDSRYQQIISWMFLLSAMTSREIDEVQIGIHSEDPLLLYYTDIMLAWKHMLALRKTVVTPLNLPLKTLRKTDIISLMNEELMNLAWFCEKPIVRGDEVKCCGDCTPCQTFVGAVAARHLNLYPKVKAYVKENWFDPKAFPVKSVRTPKYATRNDIE